MTDEQMAEMVKELVDEPRFDRFVPHYLERAKSAMMEHLFPFEDVEWSDVPVKHHGTVVEIAVYLVNRRGGEGETTHSESGVSRSYESAGIPASYFKGIVPHVGIPT